MEQGLLDLGQNTPDFGRIAESYKALSEEIPRVQNIPSLQQSQDIVNLIQTSVQAIQQSVQAIQQSQQTAQQDIQAIRQGQQTAQQDIQALQASVQAIQQSQQTAQQDIQALQASAQAINATVQAIQITVQDLERGQEELQEGQEELRQGQEELRQGQKDLWSRMIHVENNTIRSKNAARRAEDNEDLVPLLDLETGQVIPDFPLKIADVHHLTGPIAGNILRALGQRAYVEDAYRMVTSKTAQRTLLHTILIAPTAIVLYGLAVVGYLLFYHSYLPQQVATLPVHLQYGYGANPYGMVSLEHANLKDLQVYDISVSLTLPRSPPNLDRGNFMVALQLLDGRSSSSSSSSSPLRPLGGALDPSQQVGDKPVLHSSTRPALLPYTHPMTSLASRVMFLLYHVAFPYKAETTRLVVPMAERIKFPRGARLPTELRLELQAGQGLQVYSAAVTLTAQLTGLRWAMYHHRLLSFAVLTAAFWACEMGFATAAWLFLSVTFDGNNGLGELSRAGGKAVKEETVEGDGLSDTERTFPSTSQQPPLRFEGRVKQEPFEDDMVGELLPPLAPGAEADDEDDDPVGGSGSQSGSFRDSGIGTSYSDRPPSGEGAAPRKPSRRGR